MGKINKKVKSVTFIFVIILAFCSATVVNAVEKREQTYTNNRDGASGRAVCETHSWGDVIVDKQATHKTKGIGHRECLVCGAVSEDIAIDYLDKAVKLTDKNDKTYWCYYRDGKKVTGNGWIKEDGIRAYYRKDGKLYTGWHTITIKDGDKRKKCKFYFGAGSDGTPRMARGYTLIKDKPYYFKYAASSVYCGRAMPKGTVTNSEGEILYYSKGDGKLKTGWIGIDGKPYYFYKSQDDSHRIGGRAYNYTSEQYPRLVVGEEGYMTGSNAKLYAYAINAMNKYGWTMEGAYEFSYKLQYANRPYRPETVKQGALYGFSKGKGNCYVMNCCFHVMLELLADKYDIEIRQVKSSVGSYEAPHSWLEVKHGNKWWVYDANFRNETGKDGFKIYYGKKNTWKYNTPSKGDKFHKEWSESDILEKGF